nr:hypothetical protein [Tanacetum cinerariifolium]
MNQQHEQQALFAVQREQELLAQKQVAQEKEEPSQNSDFRQLIGEMCGTKVCEEQNQNMEDTIDDESFSVKDVPKENFKIYSNSLFDKEIIAESDLIEYLLNRDMSTISYPYIDSFLEEFFGELTHIDLVPPGTNKADFDPEEEIRLIEELFDSHMEEIELFLATNELMPLGIENEDYDSEEDIYFLEEFLSDSPLPLPKNDSSNFNHHDDPSFPHPPLKPPML